MPYCSKCGMLVKDDDCFCKKCGVALKKSAPLTCRKCGSTLKADDRFCMKCGQAVESTNYVPVQAVANSSNTTVFSDDKEKKHVIRNTYKYTNVCLNCGVVLADNVINCNKCGYHVETVKCPVCGNATNPFEATCSNCNSNIADLVKSDMDKSAAVLQVLLESDDFEQAYGGFSSVSPSDKVLRLARQNSITGLAIVYASEIVTKRDGSYAQLAEFTYEERSPDEWDNPKSPEIFNPHDKYATKQEYIEALREESKRPDFGFFCWAITYARTAKDIYAYRICILLSNLYTILGELFDRHNYIITPIGVELQQQAYGLLCVAHKNQEIDYSKDDVVRKMFANVRYRVARQYYYIEQLNLNEPDEDGNFSRHKRYYSTYKDGYKKAFDLLQNPLLEDQICTMLLSGLMHCFFGYEQEFIDAWNSSINDSTYINSEKDVMDEGIFSTSAICMSRIAMRDGNINVAINILKFSYSHLTRKIWGDKLQEEFSKYQQDRYGNIVYVE